MRPDKKKNRHHDSVKCENKAKQKASEKAKKEEKSQHQKKQQQPSGAITKDKNETSSSSKNENFSTTTDKEEVIEKTIPDPKYSKRSVTSNWTKYEIPSDDEDNGDVFATGPEFQFVIEKSSQAADHLMLSSEKQWQKVDEPEIANQQQNEHFALNLKNLETALDCIPLYEFDMFHMKKSEIDVSSHKKFFYSPSCMHSKYCTVYLGHFVHREKCKGMHYIYRYCLLSKYFEQFDD